MADTPPPGEEGQSAAPHPRAAGRQAQQLRVRLAHEGRRHLRGPDFAPLRRCMPQSRLPWTGAGTVHCLFSSPRDRTIRAKPDQCGHTGGRTSCPCQSVEKPAGASQRKLTKIEVPTPLAHGLPSSTPHLNAFAAPPLHPRAVYKGCTKGAQRITSGPSPAYVPNLAPINKLLRLSAVGPNAASGKLALGLHFLQFGFAFKRTFGLPPHQNRAGDRSWNGPVKYLKSKAQNLMVFVKGKH